jgi:hypothetical protein
MPFGGKNQANNDKKLGVLRLILYPIAATSMDIIGLAKLNMQ